METREMRQRAVDRGLALVDRVEALAATVWSVPSQTEAGVAYTVALVDGRLRCECPSGAARGICAHAAAVALTLVAGPLPTAAAPAAPLQPATVRHPRRQVDLI